MAAALPYLLVAAGYGVKRYSDKRVADKQKQLIGEMSAFQREKARGSEAAINKFLDSISPTARADEGAKIRDELQNEMRQSVGAGQAFDPRRPVSGRVSEDFATRSALNEAAVKNRIEKAMKELAIIGSPSEQGVRQGIRFGRAAGDVDTANRSIRNMGNAYEGVISRVRPSYGEEFLGQLLIGLGTAGVGGKAAGAAAAGGTIFGDETHRRRQNLYGGRPYNVPRT